MQSLDSVNKKMNAITQAKAEKKHKKNKKNKKQRAKKNKHDPQAENQIQVLAPYFSPTSQLWVFDDEAKQLKAEAFVCGASELIDDLVYTELDLDYDEPERGFRLIFSKVDFPGSQRHLRRIDKPGFRTVGTWYEDTEGRGEAWLCPALNKYFTVSPDNIYVQAQGLPQPLINTPARTKPATVITGYAQTELANSPHVLTPEQAQVTQQDHHEPEPTWMTDGYIQDRYGSLAPIDAPPIKTDNPPLATTEEQRDAVYEDIQDTAFANSLDNRVPDLQRDDDRGIWATTQEWDDYLYLLEQREKGTYITNDQFEQFQRLRTMTNEDFLITAQQWDEYCTLREQAAEGCYVSEAEYEEYIVLHTIASDALGEAFDSQEDTVLADPDDDADDDENTNDDDTQPVPATVNDNLALAEQNAETVTDDQYAAMLEQVAHETNNPSAHHSLDVDQPHVPLTEMDAFDKIEQTISETEATLARIDARIKEFNESAHADYMRQLDPLYGQPVPTNAELEAIEAETPDQHDQIVDTPFPVYQPMGNEVKDELQAAEPTEAHDHPWPIGDAMGYHI